MASMSGSTLKRVRVPRQRVLEKLTAQSEAAVADHEERLRLYADLSETYPDRIATWLRELADWIVDTRRVPEISTDLEKTCDPSDLRPRSPKQPEHPSILVFEGRGRWDRTLPKTPTKCALLRAVEMSEDEFIFVDTNQLSGF